MSQTNKPRYNQIQSFCFFQLIIERINQNPAVTGLDINSIKRKYRTPFNQLKDIITKYDILHFIHFGLSEDAYDAETATILLQLGGVQDKTELLDLVHQEFIRWTSYAIAGEKSEYKKLANAIYEWKRKNFKDLFPRWILN